MAVIFSYGIDTMALPENIMSYSTQIGRRPSMYFQWYNIENPSDYHFPFTDSADDGEFTTDGHYYLFTLVGMAMGVPYSEAEKFGQMAERPDTYVLSKDDLDRGYVYMGDNVKISLGTFGKGYVFKKGQISIGRADVNTFLRNYTIYVDENNHAFKLTNNIISWEDHVMTQEDINNKYFILGTDAQGRQKKFRGITLIIKLEI